MRRREARRGDDARRVRAAEDADERELRRAARLLVSLRGGGRAAHCQVDRVLGDEARRVLRRLPRQVRAVRALREARGVRVGKRGVRRDDGAGGRQVERDDWAEASDGTTGQRAEQDIRKDNRASGKTRVYGTGYCVVLIIHKA